MCDFHYKKIKFEAHCLSYSLNVEMQPLCVYSDAKMKASKITSLEIPLCLTFWIFFTINSDYKNSFFSKPQRTGDFFFIPNEIACLYLSFLFVPDFIILTGIFLCCCILKSLKYLYFSF